jgi:acetyl esterase/lipase
MYAAGRTLLTNLSNEQDRAMNPTTEEVYLEYCYVKKVHPRSISLSNGAKAYWFGKPNAKRIFVHFHGGGYVVPLHRGVAKWLDSLVETVKSQGHDFAVLSLAYGLAPENPYPQQMMEAAELLRYLVQIKGRDPASMMIGGESAGGHITLGLLSHMLHPHPKLEPLDLGGPLMGALVLTSLVDMRVNYDSVRHNAGKDLLDRRALDRYLPAFMGVKSPSEIKGDAWIEPRLAPPGWWHGLNRVVKSILVQGGGNEIMIGESDPPSVSWFS